ncbi:MAG: endonuclease/exonuclease/phosphatase family protein [Spirochaetaceae bacterium]|nr:MAG: endonuclease/exonuclease/phosphatase family protein [Spirochaetaceae bacterium]
MLMQPPSPIRPPVARVAVLLAAVALATCFAPWISRASGSDGEREIPLTLLSFNIRLASAPDGPDGWEYRRGLAFDVIRKLNPDIVGFQEPELEQIHDLIDAFGDEYGIVGRSAGDGAPLTADKADGKFNAVMYRTDRFRLRYHETFWFSETPNEPGSVGWDAALPRIATWVKLDDRHSGETLYVYSVHLDYASQRAREQSVALLLGEFLERPTDGPVFVLGDFNANELNPAMRLLLDDPAKAGGRGALDPRPLADTYRVLYPDVDLDEIGTFHDFTGEPLTTKIDFVLAPIEIPVLEAGIIRTHADGRYPSDHFPVYAVVDVGR